MKEVKRKLIEDYERYVKMYNSKHNLNSWKIKYISIIVYISDLFEELFDDDIEMHTFTKIEE